MNTTTIAGLYTFYRDCLALPAGSRQGRTLPQLLLVRLRASAITAAAGRGCRVSLTDTRNKAWRLDICCLPTQTDVVAEVFCPARVHAWAVQQLPYADADGLQSWGSDHTWRVTTHARNPNGEPAIEFRTGTAEDFATLLRGIRSYQRKQYRRAQKLAAQLWQYHLAKGYAAAQADELSELLVGPEGISRGTAEGRIAA